MNKATNVKKQILASQIAYKRTQNNEVQLEKALAKFFNKLKKEVLNALDEYWKDYQMLQGHIDLITAPVHEAHKEYYELLTLYIKREYRLGSAEAKRLVKLANSKQMVAGKSMRMPVRAIIKKDNDLFGTLPSAEERLLNRTFTASERTLSRVDSQINQIITDGYRSGKGINDVANSLNQRFDQLTSWESKRIARTEIHNSHNTAVMDTYKELDVEYTMWIAAEDERTRDSHLEINGEIIPMGGTYSNGLAYPGDTSGDIEEWINCRCSNAPFVVPYGFMAPSFSPFREDDLIKIDGKDLNKAIEELQAPPSEPETNYNAIFKGEPKIYESSEFSDRPMTVYDYGDRKLLFDKGETALTHEEVIAHINSLPQEFRNTDARMFKIHDYHNPTEAGSYSKLGSTLRLYKTDGRTKSQILDTFTHELAHSVDSKANIYQYSNKEAYLKIFKEDNKLYKYVKANGRTRTPKKFPTEYAGRSYLKFNKNRDKFYKGLVFVEDFAESSKLYLNPSTHKEFVKAFPNRAKYLEGIYGKPKFNKNSPLYKSLVKEGKLIDDIPKNTSTKPKYDPVKIGSNVKKVTHDSYEGGAYKGLKTIEYENGTKISFRKANNDTEYPFQTLDKVTINGKTYKYLGDDVYDHFKYQDKQLTRAELKFADDFVEYYGTYAGKGFNNFERNKISKEDLNYIKDDEAFKWLNENKGRYNEILEKSVIKDDIVTMRIQDANYAPEGATTIKDKAFTSSSAGMSRTQLIDSFGNAMDFDDNWTVITVTPAGTKGARFQGNSVGRIYGDISEDFEREVTYKQNMEFDILLQDNKNKIIIQQPKGV